MYGACPWSSWIIPVDICCGNSSKKLQQGFIIKGMRSYLLKVKLQIQSTETSFCICLWSYNQVLSKFYYFIQISLALIKWNSRHCHLMELFKSKESFKGKVDSKNNWKTAWPRMILEWHLFLRLSLEFVRNILSFVQKHQSFYLEDVCSFSVFFI